MSQYTRDDYAADMEARAEAAYESGATRRPIRPSVSPEPTKGETNVQKWQLKGDVPVTGVVVRNIDVSRMVDAGTFDTFWTAYGVAYRLLARSRAGHS